MVLDILVSHLERVCGLNQQAEAAEEQRPKTVEDTNLEEIVQLLRLLQEAMRISADAELAQAKFQFAN